MRFVHKQPVNAQFLKRHHAVFFLPVRQLLQLGFQIFLGLFHLLDGVALAVLGFGFGNSGHDFINLRFNHSFLALRGEGDFLKLAVSDDYRVIVTGSNPGAEFLPAGRLKVPFCGYQYLCAGVKAQKIAAPLLG